jgi:hypothetical protein
MAGVYPIFNDQPVTYPVNVPVLGGQLVSADTSVSGIDAVKPSQLGDVTVVGVALTDADPASTSQVGAATPLPAVTTVARECIVTVLYTDAASFGQVLKASGNGGVTPYRFNGATPDTNPELIIGRCRATTAAGAIGLAGIQLI